MLAPAGTLLAEFLADVGIKPRSFREAYPMHIRCPKCDGGREHEDSLVLTIDPGRKGAVWHCHRGTCGWTDFVVIDDGRKVVPFAKPKRTVREPSSVSETDKEYPDSLYAFFDRRGISRGTVDEFGIYRTSHWFAKHGNYPEGNYPAIAFPYAWKGSVVNRKYLGPHGQYAQEKDPLPTLYNVDSVIDMEHVVWVEGEKDCLAVREASWQQVVSLKDGAPDKLRDEDDPKRKTDRRFEALATHAELLEKIQKFYLAGDQDEPGVVLREELARRLGRHRCWIVRWPDDCKDANDVLLKHGPEEITDRIHAAKPYPIEDVQEITGQALVEYLARPAPATLETGIVSVDAVLKLPGEGRLIVMTGMPNAGKSQFMVSLMMQLMRREGRRFLVFSPEMQPWEEFCAICAQVLLGKPPRPSKRWPDGTPIMTADEQALAGDWMQERLRFLSSDAEDRPPTFEWVLDRGTQSVLRLGITDLVVDPWNELEHQRNGMSETDYSNRALQKGRAWSLRYGCNLWIITHPTKLKPPTPGAAIPPPGPYDINGSAAFANKTDIGITIHTQDDGGTKMLLWKSRFLRWGRKSTAAELVFDPVTGRFGSPMGDDAWGTE